MRLRFNRRERNYRSLSCPDIRFTRTERDATLLLGLDDEGTLEEGRTVGSRGFCPGKLE